MKSSIGGALRPKGAAQAESPKGAAESLPYPYALSVVCSVWYFGWASFVDSGIHGGDGGAEGDTGLSLYDAIRE